MALACALNTLAAPARWPILELAVWPGFRARGRLAGTWDAMTTTKPIRVLIADDHAMVRSGLAAFLMASDDLELVGEASNGLEAVRVVRRLGRMWADGSGRAWNGRRYTHPRNPSVFS